MTDVLLALAPIVVVLVLLALRVPALWAAAAGLVAALPGALTVFAPTVAETRATFAQMGPTILVVIFIVLGGLGLAETMARSGAQDVVARWLQDSEAGPDRTLTLMLLVFGLTPFMESVTGFGIGVVITAPLLIRQGLAPVPAVTVGLLGLVSVPWGSLAPGLLVSAQLGGQDFADLGVWTAVLSLPVLVVAMAAVFVVLDSKPSTRRVLIAVVVVLVQWAGLIGASLAVGPPLTGALAAVLVIVALLMLSRISNGPLPTITPDLARAITPYLILIGGILITTGALALAGHPHRWGWLSNPALWLMITALLAPIRLRVPRGERVAMVPTVLRRWADAGGTVVIFLVLGIVMAMTGMAEHLAVAASGMGLGFVATLPAIGALGGYLTGSNTGAAAMFSSATTTAAAGLGTSPMVALAGQNVAASFAMIASPPRVALASAVALPAGQTLPARPTWLLVGAVVIVAVVLGAAVLAIG